MSIYFVPSEHVFSEEDGKNNEGENTKTKTHHRVYHAGNQFDGSCPRCGGRIKNGVCIDCRNAPG